VAGVDNLEPVRTKGEAKERGRNGGIASGKARREKKAMRETLEALLSMPMKSGKAADVDAVKNFAELKGKNITVQEALTIAMLQKAMKGSVSAAEWIRDTAGQKPVDNMNMNMNLPVFFEGEDELEE
jgi:hypothetical protein